MAAKNKITIHREEHKEKLLLCDREHDDLLREERSALELYDNFDEDGPEAIVDLTDTCSEPSNTPPQ